MFPKIHLKFPLFFHFKKIWWDIWIVHFFPTTLKSSCESGNQKFQDTVIVCPDSCQSDSKSTSEKCFLRDKNHIDFLCIFGCLYSIAFYPQLFCLFSCTYLSSCWLTDSAKNVYSPSHPGRTFLMRLSFLDR